MENKNVKRFVGLLIKTLMIMAAAWIIFTKVFGFYRFTGNNMFPAIKDGDLIITYRLDDYHFGEVAAYYTEDGLKFGRIVGTPGSEVDFVDNELHIDGARPAEEIFYVTEFPEVSISLPYQIAENSYFLLNDYRLDSTDSRIYGAVPKELLAGKVICIFRRRSI